MQGGLDSVGLQVPHQRLQTLSVVSGVEETIRCFQALNGTMRSEYQKNECGDIKESLLKEEGFVGPQLLYYMVPNVI